MTTPSWQITGHYYETCSCDLFCPCLLGQMAARPSKGDCTFAMAYQVERGNYGSVPLQGRTFLVLGYTPEEMAKGNWSVGLIVDDGANAEQRDAITAIASGAAGGPMAPLAGLIGKFLGVESAPIRIDRNGRKFTVKAGSMIDMSAEGLMGIDPNQSEPMFLENAGHPASNRLALARASKSHAVAFGMRWDDDSGKNSGLYAPFSWKSA